MQVVGLLDDIGEGNAEFERDEGVAVRCAAVFGIMVVAVVMLVVVVDGTHTPVTFYVPMGREEESVAESQSAAPGVAL